MREAEDIRGRGKEGIREDALSLVDPVQTVSYRSPRNSIISVNLWC